MTVLRRLVWWVCFLSLAFLVSALGWGVIGFALYGIYSLVTGI